MMDSAKLSASALEWDNGPSNFEEYREIIENGGYPALSTKQVIDAIHTVKKIAVSVLILGRWNLGLSFNPDAICPPVRWAVKV